MNYKKALLPIMITAALSGGLSGCSKDKTADEYLNSAQVLLQQGKNAEAIISIKNLLKNDSTNAEGRFLLGKSYANQGIWLAAEKELVLANKLNYDAAIVFPLLANIYYHMSDSAGIVGLLNELPENNKIESPLRYFLALSYLSDNATELAEIEFKKVIQDDVFYRQLSAAWLASLNQNSNKAIEIVDKVIDNNLSSAVAMEAKARILFIANKMEQASEQLDLYLQKRPQDNQSRLLYAVALINASNVIEAEKQADLLLSVYPNNALLNQIKAQVMYSNENFSKAKEYAEKSLRVNSDLVTSGMIAGISAYKLGQVELAYSHLVALDDITPFNHPAKKLLNIIRFQLGDIDKGLDNIDLSTADEIDFRTLSFSSKSLLIDGKVEDAKRLLDSAGLIAPDNAEIPYQKGVINLLTGNDSAIKLFEASLEKDPSSKAAVIMLVTSLVKEKKYDQALKTSEKVRLDGDELFSDILDGMIFKSQQNFVGAELAYKSVLKINPNHVSALYNLADIANQKSDTLRAIELFERVLTLKNDHVSSIFALLNLSRNLVHREEIKEIFEKNIINSNNSASSIITLAEYFIIQGQVEKAISILEKALISNPEDIGLLMLRAKLFVENKKFDEALDLFKKVVELSPSNGEALSSVARIYSQKGNMNKAIEEQLRAIKSAPRSLHMHLILSQMYIDDRQLNKAKNTLNQLPELQKNNVDFLRLRGRIAYLEKSFSESAKYMKAVYDIFPSEKILLELVHALQRSDKKSEAIKYIENYKISEKKPLSITFKLKEAELYTGVNNEKALQSYNELLILTKDHFLVLNNMAWVYLDENKLQEAMKVAKKALDKSPEDAAINNTYGIILQRDGQKQRAITFLEKSYANNKQNTSYALDYINALFLNNNNLKAKSLLAEISRNDLTDAEKERYDALLSKL